MLSPYPWQPRCPTLPALRASFEHRRRPGACAPAVAVAVAGIQTAKVAEKRTELLVDADCCDNVEMIRCAIRDWAQVWNMMKSTLCYIDVYI